MKTEITKPEEIKEILTNFGLLRENKTGSSLCLSNDNFRIHVWKEENGNFKIIIDLVIHRPCHDHDSHPSIEIEIPKGGITMCDCGNHNECKAKLTIETDSGHLMLDTFFKNYVWYKRAKFTIPKCCWEGKDQNETL